MVQLGDWYRSCELVAMPLDDFHVILGLYFMRREKVVVIAYLGGLMIYDEYEPCFVHVSQDRDETIALTALQVQDDLQRGEEMYVATVCKVITQGARHEALLILVVELLDEFWDVMSNELPSKLPSHHNVDHHIELVSGLMPPMQVPYQMPPVYLEELKK